VSPEQGTGLRHRLQNSSKALFKEKAKKRKERGRGSTAREKALDS
jgi:hypothetical protein